MKSTTKLSIVGLLAVGLLAGCGSNSSSNKSNNSGNKTEQQAKADPKKNGPTLNDFNAIQLGTDNGTSDTDIVNKYGQPNTTSSQAVGPIQADDKIWNKVNGGGLGSTFTVGFSNGKAVLKAITGLKVKRDKKITLEDFNNIQNGQSVDDITKKFGQPNGYSETNAAGQEAKDLTYTSDIQGNIGANMVITTVNNAVTGKTQTQMK